MIEIKQVITDVDGSLTDGGVYYFDWGGHARKFSTFDGEGILQLQKNGIPVMFVTASSSGEILRRAEWLDVKIYSGVKDKAALLRDNFHGLENTAFFGNDVSDLAAMQLCAFAACPADSHKRVLSSCKIRSLQLADSVHRYNYPITGFVSQRNGGQGAFRDFADMLIGYEFKFLSRAEREEQFNNLNWVG